MIYRLPTFNTNWTFNQPSITHLSPLSPLRIDIVVRKTEVDSNAGWRSDDHGDYLRNTIEQYWMNNWFVDGTRGKNSPLSKLFKGMFFVTILKLTETLIADNGKTICSQILTKKIENFENSQFWDFEQSEGK